MRSHAPPVLTARVLNRVFQRAFQAAKEIRTRTGIGRGAVSIKSAALELVEKTLGDISGQSRSQSGKNVGKTLSFEAIAQARKGGEFPST